MFKNFIQKPLFINVSRLNLELVLLILEMVVLLFTAFKTYVVPSTLTPGLFFSQLQNISRTIICRTIDCCYLLFADFGQINFFTERVFVKYFFGSVTRPVCVCVFVFSCPFSFSLFAFLKEHLVPPAG
ncbi:hypothetical protein MLD38_025326 [Melastoma candidum]|uniref:Uncharacterized protein n=1 Tax=Melastoma candidum TaxID=119954 RepID=A0ACB9NV45_9MYRT|nr:hypothetical protein MLD38_025326 [Melastoma candidum]